MSDQTEQQGVTVDAEGEAAEPLAGEPQADEPAPRDGARSRRPSSLRLPTDLTGRLPHRKVTPSSFPSSPAFPGSPVQTPVSEAAESGRSGQVPRFVSSLSARLPTDRLPVDRARTLLKQRPEVGLGIAFAGGLVIATIIKRLGRR
ncbi:MAG: hypothetical protein KGL16_12645 [Acidobacteriota bacterium]|nr:hypothetical protein [Acidobacteriota bacterium]